MVKVSIGSSQSNARILRNSNQDDMPFGPRPPIKRAPRYILSIVVVDVVVAMVVVMVVVMIVVA